jgi:hypothetical protein
MQTHERLTIDLPAADADFARAYASRKSMSLSDLVDRLIRTLKLEEEDPLGLRIRNMIGVLPRDMNVEAARDEYLAQKYLRRDDNA